LWQIDSNTPLISKKLKKFRADRAVFEGFKRTITDLANSADPRAMGEVKHGKYRYCYAIHITKSHSLLYRVLDNEEVIQLVDLDDHKNLYGRDNRF